MVSYQKIDEESRGSGNVLFEAPSYNSDKNSSLADPHSDNNPLLSSFDGPDGSFEASKYNVDTDNEFADAIDHRLDEHNENHSDNENGYQQHYTGDAGFGSPESNYTAAYSQVEGPVSHSGQNNSQTNHSMNNSISTRLTGFFNQLFNRRKYHGRQIGHSIDGVFSNLMAKPENEPESDESHPPTYEEAAADPPPIWESTVLSPAYGDEIFVDGLPVGNAVNFVWNLLVTVAFQFVGFLLTYLLHTSHAAKEGSRAGLGVTLISFGYNLMPYSYTLPNKSTEKYEPSEPDQIDIEGSDSVTGTFIDNYKSSLSGANFSESNDDNTTKTPYFAYGLIALGAFIILKSLVDYYRVKQMEKVILLPPSTNQITTSITTTQDVELESDAASLETV